jgi:glycogen operon protein
MDDQTLAFELPPLSDRQWYRSIDTALASPEDIMESGADVPISGSEYLVTGRSVVVAISR